MHIDHESTFWVIIRATGRNRRRTGQDDLQTKLNKLDKKYLDEFKDKGLLSSRIERISLKELYLNYVKRAVKTQAAGYSQADVASWIGHSERTSQVFYQHSGRDERIKASGDIAGGTLMKRETHHAAPNQPAEAENQRIIRVKGNPKQIKAI